MTSGEKTGFADSAKKKIHDNLEFIRGKLSCSNSVFLKKTCFFFFF